MIIRSLPFGIALIFLIHWLPVPEEPCSRKCHDVGCFEGQALAREWFGPEFTPKLEGIYIGVVQGLHNMPGDYQLANLLVYGLIFPLVGLFAALATGVRWYWIVGSTLAAGLFALHPDWYDLCTEFCYRMGNLTGTTYAGFCFLLLILLMPGMVLFDLGLIVREGVRFFSRRKKQQEIAELV